MSRIVLNSATLPITVEDNDENYSLNNEKALAVLANIFVANGEWNKLVEILVQQHPQVPECFMHATVSTLIQTAVNEKRNMGDNVAINISRMITEVALAISDWHEVKDTWLANETMEKILEYDKWLDGAK